MENSENSFIVNSSKPYPTLMQAWGLFGWFILFSLFFGIFSAPFSDLNDLLKSWVAFASYTLSFVALLFFVRYEMKGKGQSLQLNTSAVSIIVFVLLIPITIALIIVIEPLSSFFPMPDFMADLFKSMVKVNIPSFLTVVIAAAVLEEIVCRGIILKGLLQNMNPYKAIAWSALIFAALHLNPWQGIPAFLIGFFMGWVYYKTQSIWASIFIHFVNNGIAFYMLAKYNNVELTTKDLAGPLYPQIYFGAVVVGVVFVILLNMYFNFIKKKQSECRY